MSLTAMLWVCVLGMFQQVQAKNLGALHRAILDRPKGTPLITLSNHASCIDDPVMWGNNDDIIIT
jgi:monolysocardiolipin acyltransferase